LAGCIEYLKPQASQPAIKLSWIVAKCGVWYLHLSVGGQSPQSNPSIGHNSIAIPLRGRVVPYFLHTRQCIQNVQTLARYSLCCFRRSFSLRPRLDRLHSLLTGDGLVASGGLQAVGETAFSNRVTECRPGVHCDPGSLCKRVTLPDYINHQDRVDVNRCLPIRREQKACPEGTIWQGEDLSPLHKACNNGNTNCPVVSGVRTIYVWTGPCYPSPGYTEFPLCAPQ
jgi:hypothetical protein